MNFLPLLNILLIDNTEEDILDIKNSIANYGLSSNLIQAKNVCECKKLLLNKKNDFNITLIDNNLPDISGLDLCKLLINKKINIPMIMLTASGSEQLAISALKLGVDDYIIKDRKKNYLDLLPVVILDTIKKHRYKEECLNAEMARKKYEERNEALLNAIPDLMLLIDKNGIFIDYHAASINLLFAHPEKFLGKTLSEVLPKKISQNFHECIKSVINTNQQRFYEYELEIKDEPLFFEARFVKCGDDNSLVIVRNISERKQAEIKLDNLLKRLNEKNNDLEQIINIISHDLRSPLLNVQGFIDEIDKNLKFANNILNKNNFEDEKLKNSCKQAHNFISYIYASTSKIDTLLTSLLQISRLGRVDLKIKKINMNKLVSNIGKTLQYILQNENIEFIIKDLPECYGDEVQINQVFSNLIENAIKFRDESKSCTIQISGKIKKNVSVYCVKDNGIGIQKKNFKKIFNIFQKLNPDKNGQGLGLAIANRIISRHNGKIKVESEAGAGTNFYVSLPANKIDQFHNKINIF